MNERLCLICKHRELHPDRPIVCHRCEDRMAGQLRLLAAAIPWLATIASNEPTPAGHYNLAAAGLTWPAHLGSTLGPDHDQLDLPPIATTLGRWIDRWALTTDRMPARHYIRQLLNHLEEVAAWDTAITDFATDLTTLVAATRRAMHRDLRATRYAAPCPHCGQQRLTKACGAEEITCGACEAIWDDNDYKTAAIQALPDQALLYAHEIATMLGIKPNIVDQWCWRGRLTPDAHDGNPRTNHPEDRGRPYYTAGQARRVAHEVALYREGKAQLTLRILYEDGLFFVTDPILVHAGTTVGIDGEFDITLGRGATVTIGPITEQQAATVLADISDSQPERIAA